MEILVVETSELEFKDIEQYLKCVSPVRRAAVLKKKADSDRVQSLIGALLLRSELSRRTGIPIKKISFEKGMLGKPYLKGGKVQFSLSHTKGVVCAAFTGAENGEIGVDIELSSRKASEKLKEKVLSPAEHEAVRTPEDFISVWVKKEAFLKRTGIGIATDIRRADTSILPDTYDFPFKAYRIGVSGKYAQNTEIQLISLEELLSQFAI